VCAVLHSLTPRPGCPRQLEATYLDLCGRFLADYGYIAEPGKEGDDDAVPEPIRSIDKFRAIRTKRKKLLVKVPQLKQRLSTASTTFKTMAITLTKLRTQGKERTLEQDQFVVKLKDEFEINQGWGVFHSLYESSH